MSYENVADKMVQESGVEYSTMMNSPCLRYNGDFIAIMFEKEDALIIKISPSRVDQLIADENGMEFNFTKKNSKNGYSFPPNLKISMSFIFTRLSPMRRKSVRKNSRDVKASEREATTTPSTAHRAIKPKGY